MTSHIPCLGKCGSTACNHECFCCIALPQEPRESFVKSGQRQNLIDLIEKFPALYMTVIDSAYVAGLDDATASTQASMREEIAREIESLVVDPDANDVTDHFIADDAYESKVEAFFYGYNQALSDLKSHLSRPTPTGDGA